MDINFNYLICSADRIDESYDIKGRPDPDSASKKLCDDIISVYFSDGVIGDERFTIENLEQQIRCYFKKDWESAWENYEKVNKNPKPRDENLNPPFYTIRVKDSKEKEWLLSADYIGPSINWAMREVKNGALGRGEVIDALNVCRTIGGHIVWPRGSHLEYKINQARGGIRAVYDRIDWTLYLVKLCYQKSFSLSEINEKLLERYQRDVYYKIHDLVCAICESKDWFKIFGSFENFCNQFILRGSFVDEKYEIKWFAKQLPVFPDDYRQFLINNTEAVNKRNQNICLVD